MQRIDTRAPARQQRVIAQVPDAIVTGTLRDASELDDLREDWHRLSMRMHSKTALHDWQYLLTWWETFGRRCPITRRPGEHHVLIVRSGSQIVGILPFFAIERSKFSLMPKRLRPFGYAGRLEPYDLTEEPLVAIDPEHEELVLAETNKWLNAGLSNRLWDCCVFKWFGHSAPPITKNAWQRVTKKPGPAHVALPETWTAFRKGLSKSMRDNLPYYGRLLTRHGHEWQFTAAEIGPDWTRALDELIRLHRLRACRSNDADRVDHLSTSAHRDFLNALHDNFLGETRCFIGLLTVDGAAVAAQLFLEDAQTLTLSYSGFDDKWSRYSPLLVLQAEAIKQAIERGVKRLDFLCGEAQWQERWQPVREFPINKLTLASRRPLATIRCINYVLAREIAIYWHKCRLSRWLKRTRPQNSLQSLGQALYLGAARHAHLLTYAHRVRLHV